MPEVGPIMTVGHSTRSLEELIRLLGAHGVARLIDVRSVPRSRRTPQFNRETLPQALQRVAIGYEHLPGLGGWRRAHADSANLGWRNASFRGYADYMQTEPFDTALRQLLDRAAFERVAIMCAEALPWRCHRWLIADALSARGVEVEHLLSPAKSQPHRLTPWAIVEGGCLRYPA